MDRGSAPRVQAGDRRAALAGRRFIPAGSDEVWAHTMDELAQGKLRGPWTASVVHGELRTTLQGPRLAQDFLALVEEYVAARYAPRG